MEPEFSKNILFSLQVAIYAQKWPFLGFFQNSSKSVHYFFVVFGVKLQGNSGYAVDHVSYLGKLSFGLQVAIYIRPKMVFFMVFS